MLYTKGTNVFYLPVVWDKLLIRIKNQNLCPFSFNVLNRVICEIIIGICV